MTGQEGPSRMRDPVSKGPRSTEATWPWAFGELEVVVLCSFEPGVKARAWWALRLEISAEAGHGKALQISVGDLGCPKGM